MDLSEKQESLLEYIKRFQEEKGRNPRLSELASNFGVSNSAILQRLEALKESGYIDMPEGVLSISTRPRFDVFISYSVADKQIAEKIHKRLVDEGFRVWRDNFELKTGDYFIKEIFKAIRNSKVFLLLISDDSLKSNFVKEELSHAKNYSIYKGQPKILPVVIKKVTLEIFPEISPIQRLESINLEDEAQMIQLLDDIQVKAFLGSSSDEAKKFSSGFNSFKNRALKDLQEKVKNKDDYDYYEFYLEPYEDPGIKNAMEIEGILKNAVVDIKRWGGFKLPAFYPNSENLKPNPINDGLMFFKEMAGAEAWFREWELHSFYMDTKGNFFYRSSLRESYAQEVGIKGKFSIDWLVLDVTRSLMFTKNLIQYTTCKKWKITLHYHGLEGKTLTILNQRRFPLFMEYKKEHEDDYEVSLTISADTSVEDAAYNICYEILWLFGWKGINEQVLKSDISSITHGIYPE